MQESVLNINIGIMGHVDSGKTSLGKLYGIINALEGIVFY